MFLVMRFFYRINAVHFALFFVILTIVIPGLVVGILNEFFVFEENRFETNHTRLFISIFVAPFFETSLFQSVAFKYLRKLRFLNDYTITFLSACLFALSHTDLTTAISSFIGGICFCFAYIISEKRNWSPFLMVFAIHALRNSFVLVCLNKV
ncbi:MAG: type II CAAX prenyl endopeptidase Rce1 family protein [Cyclobacteriaceae bacterium]